MSEHGLAAAVAKMEAAGANGPAIDVFSHHYRQASAGVTGLIPEDTISPLTDPPQLSAVTIDEQVARDAIARTVIIKLNGGLGTSMGLDQAKTLLPVREGLTFLDLIVKQIMAAREAYDAPLPLLFMNSFRTREDTLAASGPLRRPARRGAAGGFPAERRAEDHRRHPEPVEWPADPPWSGARPATGTCTPRCVGSGVLRCAAGGRNEVRQHLQRRQSRRRT